jgi:predicted hydrolase (HD superfamily)
VKSSPHSAEALAYDLLAGQLPVRWAHSLGVRARSAACLPLLDADGAEVLDQAAILHDVGYSPSIALTGFHALDGARHLRSLDYDERVTNLVAHHSCAAAEADLRDLSGALADFDREDGLVADCLIFCDMTTRPDGGLVDINGRLAEILRRYGEGSLVGCFIAAASPRLRAATNRVEVLLAGPAVV